MAFRRALLLMVLLAGLAGCGGDEEGDRWGGVSGKVTTGRTDVTPVDKVEPRMVQTADEAQAAAFEWCRSLALEELADLYGTDARPEAILSKLARETPAAWRLRVRDACARGLRQRAARRQ